ncbi:MAG TPA: transposase [Pirellulales bacterium]|nr:transposase [Pirellulales bacterium]
MRHACRIAAAIGGEFENAFHNFKFEQEKYMTHYHKRSNVERTFSAVKRKFGDAVMGKTDTAMTNEVLCKVPVPQPDLSDPRARDAWHRPDFLEG